MIGMDCPLRKGGQVVRRRQGLTGKVLAPDGPIEVSDLRGQEIWLTTGTVNVRVALNGALKLLSN